MLLSFNIPVCRLFQREDRILFTVTSFFLSRCNCFERCLKVKPQTADTNLCRVFFLSNSFFKMFILNSSNKLTGRYLGTYSDFKVSNLII